MRVVQGKPLHYFDRAIKIHLKVHGKSTTCLTHTISKSPHDQAVPGPVHLGIALSCIHAPCVCAHAANNSLCGPFSALCLIQGSCFATWLRYNGIIRGAVSARQRSAPRSASDPASAACAWPLRCNNYVQALKKRLDITPDPGGHRPQRPCAQGRTCAQQELGAAPGQIQNRTAAGAGATTSGRMTKQEGEGLRTLTRTEAAGCTRQTPHQARLLRQQPNIAASCARGGDVPVVQQGRGGTGQDKSWQR